MNAPSQYLNEVHRAIQAEQIDVAERLLRTILQNDETQSEAWNLLGWIQSQQKQFSAAIDSIGRAIALYPQQAVLHRNLGSVYQAASESEHAIACFERAIELAPEDAEAHNELGVTLRAKKDYKSAAECLRKAIRLQPDVPLFLQNLAEVLGNLNEFEEANQLYEKAIELAPTDATLRNGAGVMLQSSRKDNLAIERFLEAINLAPNNRLYENNLAAALQSIRKEEEGVKPYKNILQTLPDSADTHINIGNFYHARNDLENAVVHFGHAITIDPADFVAHNNLGSTLLDQGKFSEAVDHFKKSLHNNPNYAPAYFNLSDLSLNKQFLFTDDQIRQMQTLVSAGDLPPESASAMLFAVGNHFDVSKNYVEAFRAYEVANDIQRQINDAKDLRTDLIAREAHTKETIDFFDHAYFDDLPAGGSNSEMPIFVVGMPRSGSTLIEQIISSHPAAVTVGELEEIGRIATIILPQHSPDEQSFPFCLQGVNQATIGEMTQRYLDHLQQLDTVAPHWEKISRVVDKMWGNFFYLGFLHTLFPKARFIHSRRDAMDIGLSCFFRRLYAVHWSWDLEEIGHYHRLYDHIMQHWRKVLPAPIYEVDYEKLTQDPEEETRKLIQFCGLPWDDRCLAFYENQTAVHTASRIQVREPIYQSSIGRWKNYAKELAPLKAAIEKA